MLKCSTSLNRMLSTYVFGLAGKEIQDVNGRPFPKSTIVDLLENNPLTIADVDTFVLTQRMPVDVTVSDILWIMSKGNGYIKSFDFDVDGLHPIEFRIIDGSVKYFVSVNISGEWKSQITK